MLGKYSVIEPHPQFSPRENFLVEKYLTLGIGICLNCEYNLCGVFITHYCGEVPDINNLKERFILVCSFRGVSLL